MKNDILYLTHVKQAIEKIKKYTSSGYEYFAIDDRTQDAVIRNFEIIGEACTKITEDTKALKPDIPWRNIAGLRDVLIHNYIGVDIMEVWNVVEHNLPELEKAVDDLLN